MPIYEYQCESCKDVIEAWQSLSDKPMSTCPNCKGTLKKLISVSSFQLKGGGWYADGYSSSSSSNCSTSCKASSSSSSTDSKPACAKSDKPCCGC